MEWKRAIAARIPVLGYAPNGGGEALKKAGAEVFSNMSQLPEIVNSL